MKVLIGSCIYQKPTILMKFLESVKALKKNFIHVEYIFIDDNIESKSSEYLAEFKDENRRVYLYKGYDNEEKYICDEHTHYWNKNTVDKVINYKNFIINKFLEGGFDYLFFIDSDIILHNKTLIRLLSLDKDIVSTIFWTRWQPDKDELPQVWLQDNYSFYKTQVKDYSDEYDRKREQVEFLNMLKIPGTYKVGGLGACTLIKRKVLESGVDFSRLYNISFVGEDRHFCIRAVANNFELYVDTFYPAYHIYREEALKGVDEYKNKCLNRDVEIVGEQLCGFVNYGIKSLNTYSYNGWDEDYQMFFTEKCIENLQEEYSEKLYQAQRDKTIHKCDILSFNMEFNNRVDRFWGTVDYTEIVFRDEKKLYSKYIAEVEVIKITDGIWRIDKFNKIDNKK